MRLASLDYARLAQVEDPDYKKYSPILNDDKYNTIELEFNINEPLPRQPAPRFFSKDSLKWIGIRNTQKVNQSVDAWKWAFREKRKFEHVLREFQRLNKELGRILPLWTAAQIKLSKEQTFPSKTSQQNENAQRLGIAPHARLWQLSSNADAKGADFILRAYSLDAPQDARTIAVGKLTNGRKSRQDNVLVEYKGYRPCDSSAPSTSVRERVQPLAKQLARLLASAGEHELSTLPLKGIIEQEPQQRYAFVFDYPKNTDCTQAPMSLYTMIHLNNMDNRLDLQQRFSVAQTISRSIGAFHADGWVHKSMRSESIAFFHRQNSTDLIVSAPYLINFEFSRPETAATLLDFDDDLERNLYRHPHRQGPPKASFSRLHDIYALGIVLLEIGLWQTAASIFNQAVSDLPKHAQFKPEGIQSIFVNAARKRLAHHMGQPYLEAVLACITDSFNDQTSRADFPIMFYEEVVIKLSISTK